MSNLHPLFEEILSKTVRPVSKQKIECLRCFNVTEVNGVARCGICGSMAVRLIDEGDK